MQKLTGKQSKSARSLLKWNLHDLSNRIQSIVPKRIDSFEHGRVHLLQWENNELVKIYKKAGIIFGADFEVSLQQTDKEQEQQQRGMQSEGGARIILGADQSVLSDNTADKTLIPGAPDEEEQRKKEK